MNRAKRLLEQMASTFKLKLLESNGCGKQNLIFESSTEVDPDCIDGLKNKVEEALKENHFELLEFHAGGNEIFLQITSPELKQLQHKLTKSVEHIMRSKIKETDIGGDDV